MTDTRLTIRQADGAAQEVASDLLRRFFAEEGLDVPAARQGAGLAAALDDPRCAVLLAWRSGAAEQPGLADASPGVAPTDPGAPAGIACASWRTSVEHVRVAEIGALYVLPAARGRGVATALIQAVADWAADQGCGACRVAVGPEGELSHGVTGFFTARGFDDEYRKLLSLALSIDGAGFQPTAGAGPEHNGTTGETT